MTWLGVLMLVAALPVVLWAVDKNVINTRCPHCKGQVRRSATVCRHCNRTVGQ